MCAPPAMLTSTGPPHRCCASSRQHLPWAVRLPEPIRYPQERVRIDQVYLDFNTWATYGGDQASTWFRDNGGNTNTDNSF